MHIFRSTTFLLAASLLSLPAGLAQQKAFDGPPAYTAPPPPAPGSLNWVPGGLAAIAQQASTKTEFTFDRSTLALVGQLSTLDQPTRDAIARLNGISLHLYRFPAAGSATTSYDPAAVDEIRSELNTPGFNHIVNQGGHQGANGTQAGRTDVWLAMNGVNPKGAVILLSTASSLNLIDISGDISTLDLLHLRGHFGIPQFSTDTPAR
jgi:hypothetical protein